LENKIKNQDDSYAPDWDRVERNDRLDIDKYSMSMEDLEKDVTDGMEKKYRRSFDNYARYVGNGIYTINKLYSSNTRELFLMYIHLKEDIEMEIFTDKMRRKKDFDLSDMREFLQSRWRTIERFVV
jgi:hypothetical protein